MYVCMYVCMYCFDLLQCTRIYNNILWVWDDEGFRGSRIAKRNPEPETLEGPQGPRVVLQHHTVGVAIRATIRVRGLGIL